jgi:hypothetical protein
VIVINTELNKYIEPMKILRGIFFLIILVTTCGSLQAKKVNLKYNFKVGTEFAILHTIDQEVVQEVMGQSQTVENYNATRYSIKIIEKTSEGNFLIELLVDAIQLKMNNQLMNIDYDSDKDEEPPEGMESVSAGLKIPIKFLLSPKGEIVEITDAEQYVSVMSKAMGDLGGPLQQMMSGLAFQTSNVEGLKIMLGGIFFNYPGDKVKVGSSWTKESETMQMVKMKNVMENTLVEADKEQATIKQTTLIEQLEISDGIEMQGMTMKFELSGSKDAGFQIGMENGFIIKVDAVTNMSGVISLESPQLPSPISVPMTIKVTESLVQVK